MDEQAILEAWETVMGGEPPSAFLDIVREFRRRKSAICPEGFTPADFASCTIMFDIIKRTAGGQRHG